MKSKNLSTFEETMRKLLLLLSFALLPGLLWGQGPTIGTITAQDAGSCATANGFVSTQIPVNGGAASITLAGTWSGTVSFLASADYGRTFVAIYGYAPNSTTGVTTSTSNGTWQFRISGLTNLCAAATTYSSGTVRVTIPQPATVSLNNGSGSGSGTVQTGTANDVYGNVGSTTTTGPLDTGVFTYVPSTHTLNVGSGGVNSAGPGVFGGSTGVTPNAAGTGSVGSSSQPFQYLFFSGGSSTPASNNFQITGTATAARVITAPDASTTLPIATQAITWSGPTAARTYTLPDANSTMMATTTAINTVLDTGTPVSVSSTLAAEFHFNQNATAATAVTYNLPTAAAGKQFCIRNSYNGSAADTGVLTVNTSAAGQFLIDVDGTIGSTGGHITSGGAGGDAMCVVGVDATHWQVYVQKGTWTKS